MQYIPESELPVIITFLITGLEPFNDIPKPPLVRVKPSKIEFASSPSTNLTTSAPLPFIVV